ncbi:hypothetical protein K493DRAFT_335361 [Basidiobolus meristosporus CBS 931.73]|uniref:Arrestin C-terminal-like domain-containing protein n=1 Tax=Basidiobolus meristosporus CBS 931.73 TaxID=1314790 RepID=A0A1Y1YRN2_9FUNG|nr:hypothetical protein K493DRAFT_335361 [Basidiobolus meristosporus CBS 931.73]|eukprot:ORY00407.1 hypothetical protein K493DRAFT_335361 [Basidiobolus meristosporus CBS 931.73]
MKQTLLDIVLQEKFLVLHGSSTEAAGAVLRGSVVIRSKEAIKLRSLTLKLRGKVDVKWASAAGPKPDVYHVKKTVMSSSLTILEPQEHLHTIPAGETKYEFEFQFNGDLPETVHTDQGHVYYSLKAVAERSFLVRNIVAKKDVLVKRFSSTNNVEDMEPITLMRIFNSDAACDVFVPKKAYGMGETFPIRFKLTPFMENISVTKISCRLTQKVSYGVPETDKVRSVKKWREIASQHLEGNEVILPVKIPTEGIFFHACDTDYIRTEHEMALKIDFDVDGKPEVGYIRFPFTVAAENSDEFFDVLPPYAPYTPNPMALGLPSNNENTYVIEPVETELPSYASVYTIEPTFVVLPVKN